MDSISHWLSQFGLTEINWIIIAVLVVVNAPVYWGLYRLIFNDFEEFSDAIVFWFSPDLWSWMRDEFWKDCWAELKLTGLFALGAIAIAAECWILEQWVL